MSIESNANIFFLRALNLSLLSKWQNSREIILKPLVSIVIPTRNSSKTIEECLSTIEKQSYQNIETIIVDSKSTDDTREIATAKGCKVISTDWKLLGARYLGCKSAAGDYILMLDSDHVLVRDSVERSLRLFETYDMLCLEEVSYQSRTLIEKLFAADRRLVFSEIQIQLDPVYGTLLARFFRRNLLSQALEAIPKALLPFVVAMDHEIIYYEAWKLSREVGVLPIGVYHNETATLLELWRKNFRYGRSTKPLLANGYYNDFVRKRTRRFRNTSKGMITADRFMSSLLLSLKAPAYLLGQCL
jgi:glycosyltransferase involved in cell wall biosynthesis